MKEREIVMVCENVREVGAVEVEGGGDSGKLLGNIWSSNKRRER